MPGLSRGRFAVMLTVAAIGGMLTSGALVWQSSAAVFKDTATNGSNRWTAGNVAITSETTSLLFNITGLKPGDSGSKCIVVTYNGNIGASVKLYASASSGTFRQYLNLTVGLGSVGNYASCGAFAVQSTAYPTDSNVTLEYFCINRNSYANGVGSWTPSAAGQTKVYRFTYDVDPATPDSAQSSTAGVTFTWATQNT